MAMNNDKAIAKVAQSNKPTSATTQEQPTTVVAVASNNKAAKSPGKTTTTAVSSPTPARRSEELGTGANNNNNNNNSEYSSESGVFVYNEKEFSFGGGAAVSIIKARLQKLMGTDVIRILDREYVQMLGMKIQQQYEEELRQQEKRLADAELLRTLRLTSAELSSSNSECDENGLS